MRIVSLTNVIASGLVLAPGFISASEVNWKPNTGVIPLAISLIAGVFVFNRLTSRIAGPLKNPQIRLRENDYFKEEIDDINVILKKSG